VSFMDPLELTRALVSLETPTGAEGPATDLLERTLRGLGYQTVRQPVSAGRHNLYAYREPPTLVFSTHLDTVPPYVPLAEDAVSIHGRGSCDAKGLAAAMVAAAERLASRGERRIGLLFLVGEENGSDGARAAAGLGPKGRYLINGEPTENRLSVGQKGSLRVDLEAAGRAAHSAYPAEGVSAIELLLDVIERIRQMPLPSDPLLGPSTLNLGLISGGVAPNVIPPAAHAQLLIRTVEPTEPLKERIRTLLIPGVSAEFPVELPFYKGGRAPQGWETVVVSYASDLPFLAAWGERYQLGPGTIRVAHTSHEHIRKADLLRGVELYERLACDLLAGSPA
jgi:acetylornithine deacetylase